MRQRLKRKIHTLREQPPEARLKTVSSLVIAGGIGVLFLWLFLLLPIQLHVQVDTDGSKGNIFTNLFNFRPSASPDNQANFLVANPSRTPQVGGIQQYQRPLPSGPFFKTASPSEARQSEVAASPGTTPREVVPSPSASPPLSLAPSPSTTPKASATPSTSSVPSQP